VILGRRLSFSAAGAGSEEAPRLFGVSLPPVRRRAVASFWPVFGNLPRRFDIWGRLFRWRARCQHLGGTKCFPFLRRAGGSFVLF
jgi:hypothetical protein